jgi:hypothetical protein
MIGYGQKIQGTINLDPPCRLTLSIDWEKRNLATTGVVMGILWRRASADSGGIKGEAGVNMKVTEQCGAIFNVLVAAAWGDSRGNSRPSALGSALHRTLSRHIRTTASADKHCGAQGCNQWQM